MTRHANAARDLAALLADASPDVAQANADTLLALRADIAADLANAHVAAMLRTTGEASVAAARWLEGDAPTEHDEQVALFAWAELQEGQHPELAMLHATPNGGYRPITTAVKMQQEGQKRGYPDISLDVPRGKFHGLRIELKRADGGRVSAEQQAWIDRLRYYGYSAVVCHGAAEAQQCIMAYLAQEGAG